MGSVVLDFRRKLNLWCFYIPARVTVFIYFPIQNGGEAWLLLLAVILRVLPKINWDPFSSRGFVKEKGGGSLSRN